MSTRTLSLRRRGAAATAGGPKGNGKAAPRPAPHRLPEVLRLQLHLNQVSDEALARYMSEPRNIGKIAAILGAAYGRLTHLKIRGAVSSCPRGSAHVDCRCEVGELPVKDATQARDIRGRTRPGPGGAVPVP